MKISKASWYLLGAGVFAIAFASLYMLFNTQGNQQDALNADIAAAKVELTKITAERKDAETQLSQVKSEVAGLESELTKAKTELSTASGVFPKIIESVDYAEKLFGMAREFELTVTSLTSAEAAGEDYESLPFAATPFTINVKGEVPKILGYVNKLATTTDFVTSDVEVVSMTIPPPPTPEELETKTLSELYQMSLAEATITLKIFESEGR